MTYPLESAALLPGTSAPHLLASTFAKLGKSGVEAHYDVDLGGAPASYKGVFFQPTSPCTLQNAPGKQFVHLERACSWPRFAGFSVSEVLNQGWFFPQETFNSDWGHF